MYLVREIFHCKPGKAKDFVKMNKEVFEAMKGMKELEGSGNYRICTDFTTGYWTVVLEMEIDNLDRFGNMSRAFTSRPDIAEKMKGYMDLITGGTREIWKVE